MVGRSAGRTVDGWCRGGDHDAVTEDQERWAEAALMLRQYGDGAPTHVAKRIGALALAGDAAGIDRWKQIAVRLDQLRGGSLQ